MKRQLEPDAQELSVASMKDVTAKLRALLTVNNEIIGRIEACADQKFVKAFRFYAPVTHKEGNTTLELNTAEQYLYAREVMQLWRAPDSLSKLTEMEDLFAVGLQPTARTYAQFKVYNEAAAKALPKYEMLKDNLALPELRKLLNNVEAVQVALGAVESQLQNATSKEEQVKAAVATANESLAKLANLLRDDPANTLHFVEKPDPIDGFPTVDGTSMATAVIPAGSTVRMRTDYRQIKGKVSFRFLLFGTEGVTSAEFVFFRACVALRTPTPGTIVDCELDLDSNTIGWRVNGERTPLTVPREGKSTMGIRVEGAPLHVGLISVTRSDPTGK